MQILMRSSIFFTIFLVIIFLSSCAIKSVKRQEVIDGVTITYLTGIPSKSDKLTKPPKKYKVKKGDSIFSIAEKYGLDYKQIAEDNNIRGNFVIYPGQELSLRGVKTQVSKKQTEQKALAKANKRNEDDTEVSHTPVVKAEELTQSKESVGFIDSRPPPLARNGWTWPVSGKPDYDLVSNRQGIYVITPLAAKVKAANNGRVIYVGSDIEQYGKLILISHSDGYLSVYAENSQILVKNEQLVKRGEYIAVTGNAYGRGRIYFELRKEGTAIDPRNLLLIRN